MGRPFLIFFLMAALLVACSPTELTVDGGTNADASTGRAGRIMLESDPTLTLTYGESADILVQYLEGDAAQSGVQVGFALEGNASDADLMSLEEITDVEGRARTRLVAGTMRSAFRLRVSAERAPPAYVDVSVSDAGFGGLIIRARYTGDRVESARRVITIYSEVGCSPAGDYPASAIARQVTLDDESETEVAFTTLPAGLSYTAVAVVEGSTGTALATGCVDGLEVLADETTQFRLSYLDAPLAPAGTYGLELEVTADAFGDIATRGVDAGLTMSVRTADDFLDAIEQNLRTRGLMTDANALAAERMSGTPAMTLSEQLGAAGADSDEALRLFFARLLELLTTVRIGGPLRLGVDGMAATGTWDAMSLDVGALGVPDGPEPITLDPAVMGLDFAPVLGLIWQAPVDEMEVGSLALTVPVSVLVSAAMDTAASDGTSAPGAALRVAAGCPALADWVAANATLSPVCDATCVDDACLSALDGVLEAAQTAVTTEPNLDSITLAGRLTVFDDDGDLEGDRLGGTLTGTWNGAGGTAPSVFTIGTLTGARTGR